MTPTRNPRDSRLPRLSIAPFPAPPHDVTVPPDSDPTLSHTPPQPGPAQSLVPHSAALHPSSSRDDGALRPQVRAGFRVRGSLALSVDGCQPAALVWGPPGAVPDERGLRHLGQALAEVLAGRRPPASVADRLTDQAYRELLRAGRMIDSRRPPLVSAPRVQEPQDGVVEMCILVHCGERSHALAVRLERRGIQWLCTDFETR